MSRVIVSPVARWAGSVTLADPLTFPQLAAWQQAVQAASAAVERGAVQAEADGALLAGVCACVERWELAGLPAAVTPETFPATPRVASGRLLRWLIEQITALIVEADDVPNG